MLERDAFLLEGIDLGVGEAERLNLGRLDLDALALPGRFGEDPGDPDRAPNRQTEDACFVVRQVVVGDDLEAGHRRPVGEFDERETALRIPPSSDPPGHRDGGPEVFSIEDVLDEFALHLVLLDESRR